MRNAISINHDPADHLAPLVTGTVASFLTGPDGGTYDDLQTERVARLIEHLADAFDVNASPEASGIVIVPTATWNAVLDVVQGYRVGSDDEIINAIAPLARALADEQAAAHEPTDVAPTIGRSFFAQVESDDTEEIGNLPDFTPDAGPWCESIAPSSGTMCTLRPDHKGWHVAGNGEYVVDMWDHNGKTILA